MTRRPGLSLTEVLVALFLMAIGVIGVLTMFPVGAVQMGMALKDQRCAEAATQADAYIRWYWRHEIVEKQGNNEPLWLALNGGSSTVPTDDLPSQPVFVDPMGMPAINPGRNASIGGLSTLPRRTFSTFAGSPTEASQALRTCTLLDGFTYDNTGQPAVNGTTLERENRYNWLWVIQRPRNSAGTKYTANLTIVVFDKRAHQYTPPDAEHLITGSTFTADQTLVTLGSPHGPIQKGQWIMDASTTTSGTQLADFHRVASINGTTVELNLPVRSPLGGGNRAAGTAVYLDGVAEVFERAPLTAEDAGAP